MRIRIQTSYGHLVIVTIVHWLFALTMCQCVLANGVAPAFTDPSFEIIATAPGQFRSLGDEDAEDGEPVMFTAGTNGVRFIPVTINPNEEREELFEIESNL